MAVKILVFALILGWTVAGRADVVLIPDWLPEDSRFAVCGTSNEVQEAGRTLALMRDSLHPKLRQMMVDSDRENGISKAKCPTLLGPTLQWMVRVSQPGVGTNDAAYFNTYKAPLAASSLDRNMLTNRAARLAFLPPKVNLSLVFDDGTRNSIPRTVPGVDYPGVEPEDLGTTEDVIRLRLCAPKSSRHFRVLAQVSNAHPGDYEFKWVFFKGHASTHPWTRRTVSPCAESIEVWVSKLYFKRRGPVEMGVFARPRNGLWGCAGRVLIMPERHGTWAYEKTLLSAIDYGDFRDVYRYGENDRLMGFTRLLPGMVRGDEYLNAGEKILDSYSDDHPKTTRKVIYSVEDGKLRYSETDVDIPHKNEPPDNRASRW